MSSGLFPPVQPASILQDTSTGKAKRPTAAENRCFQSNHTLKNLTPHKPRKSPRLWFPDTTPSSVSWITHISCEEAEKGFILHPEQMQGALHPGDSTAPFLLCLLTEKKVKVSCSVMSDSLRPHGLHSSWNSLGQNTGVGGYSLLQGILPTQGSNPGLLHCWQILCQLSHKGSPRILVGSISLLQGIFLIQESNQGLLHCRWILYQLSYEWSLMQIWASLVAQMVKNLPAMQETWVQSLGREDPLEKEMATHSSTLT